MPAARRGPLRRSASRAHTPGQKRPFVGALSRELRGTSSSNPENEPVETTRWKWSTLRPCGLLCRGPRPVLELHASSCVVESLAWAKATTCRGGQSRTAHGFRGMSTIGMSQASRFASLGRGHNHGPCGKSRHGACNQGSMAPGTQPPRRLRFCAAHATASTSLPLPPPPACRSDLPNV